MDCRSVAKRQHGVIARSQFDAAGLTPAQVESLARRGEVSVSTRRGIWVLAAAPLTLLQQCWLAVLATDGVLSHGVAAQLWGISLPAGRTSGIAVTIPHRRRVDPLHGLRIYRLPLSTTAVTTRSQLPVTSMSRTVMDCVRLLRPKEGAILLDRALQKSWLSLKDIDDELLGPRRVGNAVLRELRVHCAKGDAESERLMHDLLRRHRIAGWEPNIEIDLGFALLKFDIVFRRQKLIVEVDGWANHVDVDRFQSDRTRQNAAQNRGWSVRRFTWHHIVNQPDYVVATIREALRSRERSEG